MSRDPYKNPLVSIIIPCYNGEHFVGEAIESALAQSHPHIETLVVDDGSTDSSRELIRRYPVRLLEGDHLGVSAARNRGIRESRGEYLVFLDSDDRLLPNAVTAGLATMRLHHKCAMAVAAHNLITESGRIVSRRPKESRVEDAYERLLRSNFIECTSSVLFRREMFPTAQGFMLGIEGSEDYELYLRIARIHEVRCSEAVVAEYRLHSTNASRDSEKMLTHTLEVLEAQKPHLARRVAYRVAYWRGWWIWRRKYGRQLTMDVARESSTPWRRRRRVSAILAAKYPIGALIVLLPGMLRRWIAYGWRGGAGLTMGENRLS